MIFLTDCYEICYDNCYDIFLKIGRNNGVINIKCFIWRNIEYPESLFCMKFLPVKLLCYSNNFYVCKLYPEVEIEGFYDNISTAITENLAHFTITCGNFSAKIRGKNRPMWGKFR